MRHDTVTRETARKRPRWLPLAATLVGVALTAAAGYWQLGRAHEKERLQRAYEHAESEAPVRVSAAPASVESLRLRKVEVEGEFLPEHLILLDNKMRNGEIGYEVVMPLKIAGSSMHVLVNRGWIAAPRERAKVPVISTPAATVSVIGMATVPGRFLELSKQEPSGPVWQNLTVARFVARSGLAVQPVVIEQQNELGDGLARAWRAPDFGVTRHYGYAVQWFAFCGLIIFLWLYFYVQSSRSKKNQKNASSAGRG